METSKVHVKSTFDDKEHEHIFLSITAVCTVISAICSIFGIVVVSCIAVIITFVLGIVAIRKKRRNRREKHMAEKVNLEKLHIHEGNGDFIQI